MITNTNKIGSSAPTPPPASLRPRVNTSGNSPQPVPTDTLSTDKASNLKAALAQTPAIRPEVMERASALMADSSYPSEKIIYSMARALVNSEDPSNKED